MRSIEKDNARAAEIITGDTILSAYAKYDGLSMVEECLDTLKGEGRPHLMRSVALQYLGDGQRPGDPRLFEIAFSIDTETLAIEIERRLQSFIDLPEQEQAAYLSGLKMVGA